MMRCKPSIPKFGSICGVGIDGIFIIQLLDILRKLFKVYEYFNCRFTPVND